MSTLAAHTDVVVTADNACGGVEFHNGPEKRNLAAIAQEAEPRLHTYFNGKYLNNFPSVSFRRDCGPELPSHAKNLSPPTVNAICTCAPRRTRDCQAAPATLPPAGTSSGDWLE
jgi:hypothetical protein